MMMSLCEMMSRWNLAETPGTFCSLHESAMVAQGPCLKILRSPCESQFFQCADGVQCPCCGILGGKPGSSCKMCEHSTGHPLVGRL